jgi:hypothetical protein
MTATSSVGGGRWRRRRFLNVLLGIIVAGSGCERRQPDNATKLVERSKSAIVSLRLTDSKGREAGTGSGFFIKGPDTLPYAPVLLVTNRHVAALGAGGHATLADGTILTLAALVAEDECADLVLLHVEGGGRGVPMLALAPMLPREGEPVLVIGNPQGLGHSVSDGIVAAIRKLEGGAVIQITAPISPGSSGSPVLNLHGQVVGVATASLVSGQNLNFAVPSERIHRLLAGTAERVEGPAWASSPIPLDWWALQTVTEQERAESARLIEAAKSALRAAIWAADDASIAEWRARGEWVADDKTELEAQWRRFWAGRVNRFGGVPVYLARTDQRVIEWKSDLGLSAVWIHDSETLNAIMDVVEMARELDPSNATALRLSREYHQTRLCLGQRRVTDDEAREHAEFVRVCEQLVALQPEDQESQWVLVTAYSWAGRHSDALRLLMELPCQDPLWSEHWIYWRVVSRTQESLGNLAKAIEAEERSRARWVEDWHRGTARSGVVSPAEDAVLRFSDERLADLRERRCQAALAAARVPTVQAETPAPIAAEESNASEEKRERQWR